MQKVAEAWAAKLEDETMAAKNAKIHNMEQKLDGHYRAFITYLNTVQELLPEESLSKTAQYYNTDLAKIDLQYQQSRKKGGKEDEEPEAVAEA